MPQKKLLVINVAALGWNVASKINDFNFQRATSILPAVTCTAQAAFRTASPASENAMVSNGLYFQDLHKVLFWEQSSELVHGERIWKKFRESGKKVGMMFWQQSLGEDVDLILSPAPIHKHGGGMIQDCYCKPRDLESRISSEVGRHFNLMHYWGPLASSKSSTWIVDATWAVLGNRYLAPDLLLTYIPHLDYDLQRHGPGSRQADVALDTLQGYLQHLRARAQQQGYEWLIFGDYAIEPVTAPAILPNLALADASLFAMRNIKGMLYPDFHGSRAFAIVDHQIAHVHAPEADARARAKEILEKLPGVASVLDRPAQRALGVEHPKGGDLLLIAKEGAWFAYPWWDKKSQAPDFASHVDIHNKPGYDPCELFFGWPPPSVSRNTARIKGTHGRAAAATNDIAWSSSLPFATQPTTFLELSAATKAWLDS